jgi:hypothetical protein
MDEADWLTATDADKMLKQLPKLKRPLSPRKLRLFCVGCARQIFDVMEEMCRRAVELAEKYADGEASLDEMTAARNVGMRRNRSRFDIFGVIRAQKNPEGMRDYNFAKWSWEATEATTRPAKPVPGKVIQGVKMLLMILGKESLSAPPGAVAVSMRDLMRGLTDSPTLSAILRDVAGNPFRPAVLEPAWQTANAVALAQTIYQQRAFDRLPILADALEEAGCTQTAMLEHCRTSGPHVRGCWVLDLVLGKV